MQKRKQLMEITTKVRVNGSGDVFVTRIIDGITPPFTKWDFLSADERRSYKKTPWANGTGKCSKCGTSLATEADFAKHFIIPDPRYFNLGECPNKSES